MIIRKSIVVTGALVAALGMTACSSDDSADNSAASSTTAAASSTTAAAVAAPDAAVLQEQFDTFFDPQSTAAEKSAVIENGEQRVALLEQYNGVLAGYPLTATVGDVTAEGDTVTTITEIGGPHGGAPVPVNFVQVDGEWVIADSSACQILGMGNLTC